MTTITATTATGVAPRRHRVLAITRLHFVNAWSVFALPWIILAVILAVNVIVWWAISVSVDPSDRSDVRGGLQYSGASFYIFVYLLVLAVQSISRTFPFALGFGVTRRNYALGTALSYVILSAGYAIALTIVAAIEQATGGWGLGGRMFSAIYFGGDEWYSRLAVFFAILLFSFFIGAMFAAIYVRWRAPGVVLSFLVITVLAAAAAAGIIVSDRWSSLADLLFWGPFGSLSATMGLVVWSLVPTAIAALIAFLVLRRVAPRN